MDLMLIVFFASLIIVASGAIVKALQNIFLTEPLLALLAGVLLGPEVLKIIDTTGIDPNTQHKILEIACQFTIAMALMATALRIPSHFFRKNFGTQTNIVLFGMILMWLFSAGLLYLVLHEFSFIEFLLIGAVITPTDPVVASTIVTGEKAEKYLPESIRNTLSFEAGSNDGLAFPIVMLSVFLVQAGDFPLQKWVTKTVLYENVLAAIIAYVVGYLAGIVMHKAHKADIMNTKAVLPYSLGLAFLLLAGLEVLKMNGIIGVFVGGLAFAKHIAKNEDIEEERIQESMERIFTIPVFFIFGLILPWSEWLALGWTAVWIVLVILLLRRIPAFFILMPFLPQFKKKPLDILIMSWYGPIGVAALLYAILSEEKTGLKEAWIIPSLVVFASTFVHGVTSVPFERLYSKTAKSKQPE